MHQKTTPVTVRIIYRHPNQNNFLQTLIENFSKLDTLKKELYIPGDFNFNLYQNQNHVGCKNNTLVSAKVTIDVGKSLQFCAIFGLKQILKSPPCITCSSASLIDHILSNSVERISQEEVINVGLSDHHLVCCNSKISRIKSGGVHKKIILFA